MKHNKCVASYQSKNKLRWGKGKKMFSNIKNSVQLNNSDDHNTSFDSVGSGIKIISGSFEKIVPIIIPKPRETGDIYSQNNSIPAAIAYSSSASVSGQNCVLPKVMVVDPRSSQHNAMTGLNDEGICSAYASTSGLKKSPPLASSTPYPEYENVTDVEEEINEVKNDNEPESHEADTTLDVQKYITEERQSCETFLEYAFQFVSQSADMVKDKTEKRVMLLKKITKYQRKIKHTENLIKNLDRMISFGDNVLGCFNNF